MIKKIINNLISNGIVFSVTKITAITVISIASVTTSAYFVSSVITSSNENVEKNDNFLSANTNNESNEVEEEVDIIASATKLIQEVLGIESTDTQTSSSKQNTSGLVYVDLNSADIQTSSSRQVDSTTPLPISNEDTQTGSSRKPESGLLGINYDDDYDEDDKYEDHEEDDDYDEYDEQDDDHDDEDEHEDDHDDEDEHDD